MPLNPRNTRTVHRTVHCGLTHTVTLLKRGDQQKAGTVYAVRLFRCRKSRVSRSAEEIAGDETADHQTVWHVPRSELDRVKIDHLNFLDRIVEKNGAYWQPEATTRIDEKLFGNEVDLACLRVDPPAPAAEEGNGERCRPSTSTGYQSPSGGIFTSTALAS